MKGENERYRRLDWGAVPINEEWVLRLVKHMSESKPRNTPYLVNTFEKVRKISLAPANLGKRERHA